MMRNYYGFYRCSTKTCMDMLVTSVMARNSTAIFFKCFIVPIYQMVNRNLKSIKNIEITKRRKKSRNS